MLGVRISEQHVNKKRVLIIAILFLLLVGSTYLFQSITKLRTNYKASAAGVLQWPMPGHDPQRTSRADEASLNSPTKPLWMKNFNDVDYTGFIINNSSLVTVAGSSSSSDLVLVPTSKGLYALRAADGSQAWFYPTSMPVGNSPTVSGGIAYFGVYDKTIHAVDVSNGSEVWQTDKAGAGFNTNPLVIGGKVLAGNRDGYFYAFSASDGSYSWSFKTGGHITYSASASPDNNTVYFASHDSYAYALNVSDGSLVWRSNALNSSDGRFPGDGFSAYWPVTTNNYVLFAGTNNYKFPLVDRAPEALFTNPTDGDLVGPVDSNGWIDAQKVIDYFKTYPERRTFFAINRSTGTEDFVTPILYVGNRSGNRYPPAIDSNGTPHLINVWAYGGNWMKGRVSYWQIGTSKIKDSGINHDSADETGAISIAGGKLFYNHKGAQGTKYVDLATGNETGIWNGTSGTFSDYHFGYDKRSYGDDYYDSGNFSAGSHGTVNPVVPIRDKVCFHQASTVMCFGEQ